MARQPDAAGHAAAAQRLDGWYGPPRLFGFMAEVQPVFDKHCVSCHDYGQEAGKKLNLAPDRLDRLQHGLQRILAQGLRPLRRRRPGRDPARPTPGAPTPARLAREIRQPTIPEHEDIQLSQEEFDRVMTWLDLNGVYYPTYACAYPNSLTGRCPLDSSQLGRLAQLTGIDLGRARNHARQSRSASQLRPARTEPLPGEVHGQATIPATRKRWRSSRPAKRCWPSDRGPTCPAFSPATWISHREEKYAARQQAEARSREAIRTGKKVYD